MNELLDRMLEAHRFWTILKGDRVVPIQRDFPNCEAKGNGCCYTTRVFWEQLQTRTKIMRPTKQPFRTKTIKLGLDKPPRGFEKW